MASYTDFAAKLLEKFDIAAATRVVSKGDFVLREGEVERNIYFIQSGAVRLFYLSEFEEQTVRLGYGGSMINSLSSYLKEKPSEFYLQAIRKTTVKALSKTSLQQMVYNDEQSMKQYILLLETLVTQQIDREVDLLITSPTERLQRVLSRSPGLFQQVPLKYIASYLRMKPKR